MATCLLVAATADEISPFLEKLPDRCQIEVLITGVGMVATAFALGRKLQESRYDFALQVGIAGAISKELSLGELVFVKTDMLYDFGAEDGPDFLSIDKLGFGKSVFKALPISGVGHRWPETLRTVDGITVNKVHGNEPSIRRLRAKTDAAVESMEGAAFYYACEQFNLPSIQIRSISNYVERRDREKWKIGLAIQKLNDWLKEHVCEPL